MLGELDAFSISRMFWAIGWVKPNHMTCARRITIALDQKNRNFLKQNTGCNFVTSYAVHGKVSVGLDNQAHDPLLVHVRKISKLKNLKLTTRNVFIFSGKCVDIL